MIKISYDYSRRFIMPYWDRKEELKKNTKEFNDTIWRTKLTF